MDYNILNEVEKLKKAASLAIDIAMSNKCCDEVQVNLYRLRGLDVCTMCGNIDNEVSVEFANDTSIEITVFSDKCKGSASSTDLNEQSIKNVVNAACKIASLSCKDDCHGLPLLDNKNLVPKLELHDGKPLTSIQKAISIASELERTAIGLDKAICNTEGARFSHYEQAHVFANSHFANGNFSNSQCVMLDSCKSYYYLGCYVIAKDQNTEEMQVDGSYTVGRRLEDLLPIEDVAKECVQNTVAKLGSKPISTRQCPVIFQAPCAVGLIKHLASAINGHAIYKKSSFLYNKLHQQVLPSWMEIQELPHLKYGLASRAYDGEGVATVNRCIVEKGKLQTYLLDTYSAKKLGMGKSTGHKGGHYNWIVKADKNSMPFEQLLKNMGSGLLVTDLMGQGVDLLTGNYSRGASGFWIENGRILHPVSEITIAGNLSDMLENIAFVGDDVEKRTSIQCGSLLIPRMTVGGI